MYKNKLKKHVPIMGKIISHFTVHFEKYLLNNANKVQRIYLIYV